jgi:predicted XRE-type DNA-binding protein
MTSRATGIVLFGDVVASRHDPGATTWLRVLRADAEAAYVPEQRPATPGFTQGDELQILLTADADPFRAVVRAALLPDARGLRWAIVAGEIEPGTGPATERTGPAFHVARELLARAKAQREGLLAVTGDPATDDLLADVGPLLPALLDELTDRQREVARLILVDDLRQAEAAERLGVARATVSVIADRGRVRHIARLARSLATMFAGGVAHADARRTHAAVTGSRA